MKTLLLLAGLFCIPSLSMGAGLAYQDFFNQNDVTVTHSTVTFSSTTATTIGVGGGFREVIINPTTADYSYRMDGSTLSLTTVGIFVNGTGTDADVPALQINALGLDITVLLAATSTAEVVAITVIKPN